MGTVLTTWCLPQDEMLDVAMDGIQIPPYGDGNIIEVFCGGTHDPPMRLVFSMYR
jgi:hypothetical protein